MTPAIRGSTRVAGIIGDPVTHSRSPAIHNAAFRAVGLDWVYVAFPVAIGAGEEAVRAGRVLGLAGLNVTMPHKAAAASACDELSDRAATLGVANTVVYRPDGTVAGDLTDGEGFVRALAEHGVDAAGRRVLVIGAGGAARAITLALAPTLVKSRYAWRRYATTSFSKSTLPRKDQGSAGASPSRGAVR